MDDAGAAQPAQAVATAIGKWDAYGPTQACPVSRLIDVTGCSDRCPGNGGEDHLRVVYGWGRGWGSRAAQPAQVGCSVGVLTMITRRAQ